MEGRSARARRDWSQRFRDLRQAIASGVASYARGMIAQGVAGDGLQVDGSSSRLVQRWALGYFDRLLFELEELNARDQTVLPPDLVVELRRLGIPNPGRHSVTDLHERLMDMQRPFLRRGSIAHR
jgi:hypothetical protein